MKCSYCGTVLRKESQFCWECGEPVNTKECYLKELKDSELHLGRKTDLDSLHRIMELTDKIYDRIDKSPELIERSCDFFDEYLPAITGIMGQFAEIKKSKRSNNDRLKDLRDKLTELLNRTEEAFEVLYRELCEHDINDLQTNIEILQAMIAMDGLTRSDFEIKD